MTPDSVIEVLATDNTARRGSLLLPRGTVETPCFMPVGTRAAVKLLTAQDLESLGAKIMLANTYHLLLRPGAELIFRQGGIHKFMNYSGSVLTDSGGYQVMSLESKVDDDGVTFTSVYDGSRVRLTPERAVAAQLLLGSDIQMTLDVCPALPAPLEEVKQAMDLSAKWASRARQKFLETRFLKTRSQATRDTTSPGHVSPSNSTVSWQFGIIQGGADEQLRKESAQRTVEINFEGYGIGGLSVGESREERQAGIQACCEVLPENSPRYLMGVGDPLSILDAVELGVDMFDCVLPTRLARHGTAFTTAGRLNLRNSACAEDDSPVDPDFPQSPVAGYSRAYLRHLFAVKEPTAARILTLHNLAWLEHFMGRIRVAVEDGTLHNLKKETEQAWAN